jgi:pyruvate/2-oxoglutarate/acetoin dehydrogenase E1 component
MIVAAIDKEAAAVGLKPVAAGGDVTIAYYTMTVSNVDLKALDKMDKKTMAAPTKDLGKLVVVMRDDAHQQVWSAMSREYLDPDRSKLQGTIQTVTERLFATYPTRSRK